MNKACFAQRRLRGDLTNVYKYLKRGYQQNEFRVFSVVPDNMTRGNGLKLKHRKFQLHMRKNLFTLKETEHWDGLSTEFMASATLEIFKNLPGCDLLNNMF